MRIHRLFMFVFGLVLSLALARESRASSSLRLVVIGDGSIAGATVDSIRARLGHRYAIEDAKSFRRKLAREWDGVDLIEALDGRRRAAVVDELRRVADAHGTELVVLVGVRGSRVDRSARIVIVGQRSEPFETAVGLGPRRDGGADVERIWAKLEPALGATADVDVTLTGRAQVDPEPIADAPIDDHRAAPADATPFGSSGPARDVAREPPADGGSWRRIEEAVVVVEPRLGFGMRHFEYADRVTPNQRGYDLGGAPLIGLGGELYPFARTDSAVLRAIGVAARYDRTVLLQSAYAHPRIASDTPPMVDTSWSNLDLALRGRIPLDRRWTLGVTAGYGTLDYSFRGAGAAAPELPGVAYQFGRAGIDARVRIWIAALTAGFDYLAVTSTGPLGDRYPRASSGGIDAVAGLAIPIAAHFEARTGVRYQRFFHAMNPHLGDANVAGGALDELGRWDSSVAFHY